MQTMQSFVQPKLLNVLLLKHYALAFLQLPASDFSKARLEPLYNSLKTIMLTLAAWKLENPTTQVVHCC